MARGLFTGGSNWLEIAVETNGGSGFTTLAPRQQVTLTPYAIFANTASNVLGTVSSAGLAGEYGNAVTLDNPGNSISGTFTGDGTGVANVDAVTLDGLTSAAFWSTAGNAGANPTNGAFLGTTDDLPLEFRVNGARALRLEYAFEFFKGVTPNLIGGSPDNVVSNGIYGAFIAGGGNNSYPNRVEEILVQSWAAWTILPAGLRPLLAGSGNTASGNESTAMGSGSTASGDYSVVGGGAVNVAADPYSTVAGGIGNSIITLSGTNSTIGGGSGNSISYTITSVSPFSFTSSSDSTIGGGIHNSISGDNATIGGGVGNYANALGATVGGGAYNTANGVYATVPGGVGNYAAGNNSFAAGAYANTSYAGSFVWSDGTSGFSDSKADQFLIQAGGGVGIGTSQTPPGGLRVASGGLAVTGASSPNYGTAQGVFLEEATVITGGFPPIISGAGAVYAYDYADGHPLPLLLNSPGGNVGIGTTTPNYLLTVGTGGAYCNGTTWVNGSDRNSKEDFAAINPRTVLEKVSALPITEWKYKVEADGTKHLGPMAQDFHAAFGLNGSDDKHISTVDEGGVALAAIQGLNEKVESGKQKAETQMEKLEAENAQLKQRLEALEKIVLNQKPN